jgi:hypothetical protein
MKLVSNSQLVDIIANLKGGTMVNLFTRTRLTIPAKWGLFKVERLCKMSTQVGCSYERSVNTRLEKIGADANFKTGHLPWGKWEVLNRIITYKGEHYARFYLTANNNAEVLYLVNGRPATSSETEVIQMYDNLFKSYSAKQANYGLTERQVIPYNPKVADIVSLSAEGETYGGVYNAVKTYGLWAFIG